MSRGEYVNGPRACGRKLLGHGRDCSTGSDEIIHQKDSFASHLSEIDRNGVLEDLPAFLKIMKILELCATGLLTKEFLAWATRDLAKPAQNGPFLKPEPSYPTHLVVTAVLITGILSRWPNAATILERG